MSIFKWLGLQIFAGEGAGGDGGGQAAATGESAVDPGQQRLLELGVPADKIRKRAKNKPAQLPQGAVRTDPQTRQETQAPEQVAAADNPTEESKTETPARMSWEEIMKDPEYNQQMQAVVQARLRSAKSAEENLAVLAPALEVLARQHGLDPANVDYKVLAEAVSKGSKFYEEKALQMGVSVEAAYKLDQQEREEQQRQQEQAQTLEQQKFRQHIQKLEQQGEEMKKTFPNFDLRTELQNPVFARMTSPNVGISVQDAYYAVHRNEIQTAAMQVTAQKTAQQISNAIRSGSMRPDENGTSGQAPSVTTFDYRKASPAERAAIKQRIYEAKARGEKLYPGR